MIWKVKLRRGGHRHYHYASASRRSRMPQRGEIINVRDIDGRLVKAVIEHVSREDRVRSGRWPVFTIQADEIEVLMPS